MTLSPLVSQLTSPLVTGAITRTDGRTNGDRTYPPLKSFRSVPRTRVSADQHFEDHRGASRQLTHGGNQ